MNAAIKSAKRYRFECTAKDIIAKCPVDKEVEYALV